MITMAVEIDDEFPELSKRDLLDIIQHPKHKTKKADCIQCRKKFPSQHRVCSFGLKRIEFLCRMCRRRTTALMRNISDYILK